METCVIIATANRPKIVGQVLEALDAQSVKPTSVILSCVSGADADHSKYSGKVSVLTGERGLTKQRNRALEAVPDGTSFVVFFDDDFVPQSRWIEVVEGAFKRDPGIVAITGNVIADGIKGAGYTYD